jgi:hypothetical protein
MLTRGWGGIMMCSDLVDFEGGLAHSNYERLRNFPSVLSTDEREIPFFSLSEEPVASTPMPNLMIKILSLQRAEGGFEVDQVLIEYFGLTLGEFGKLAGKIKVKEKTDRLILLSTAILLQFLRRYYSKEAETWESLVKKTEKWFKDEVSRTEPVLDGESIEDWAREFTEKLTHGVSPGDQFHPPDPPV